VTSPLLAEQRKLGTWAVTASTTYGRCCSTPFNLSIWSLVC